jgi:hypothetical protein
METVDKIEVNYGGEWQLGSSHGSDSRAAHRHKNLEMNVQEIKQIMCRDIGMRGRLQHFAHLNHNINLCAITDNEPGIPCQFSEWPRPGSTNLVINEYRGFFPRG